MTRAAQAPCEATTTTTTTTTSSLTDQHQATSIGNHEAYSSTTGQTPSPSKPSAAGIQSQTGGRRALSSAGSSPRPNSAVALASSATSSAAATPSQPRAPLAPLGQQPEQAASHQCRICRKVIGANEPVHLCSNCQQFICDDCASYSANEQVSVFYKITSLIAMINDTPLGAGRWLLAEDDDDDVICTCKLRPVWPHNCRAYLWERIKPANAGPMRGWPRLARLTCLGLHEIN